MRFALHLGLYCTRQLIWISVAVVIALGILAAVARFALPPLAESWKPEIEQLLSERFQRSIRIGAIDLAWRDYGLSLSVSELELGEVRKRDELLSVDRVFVKLDPWSTLREGHPVVDGLILERLRLDLDADGIPGLAGESSGGFDERVAEAPSFGIESVDLIDAEIRLKDSRYFDGPQTFSDLDLSIREQDDFYRFRLSAALPGRVGERLQAVGEFRGDIERPDLWEGTLYAEVERLHLAEIPRLYPSLGETGLDIVEGEGQVKLWIDWAGNRAQRADAELTLTGLEARHGGGSSTADSIKGQMHWAAEERGWVLAGESLRIRQQERERVISGFSIRVSHAEDGRLEAVSGGVERISAADLEMIARTVPDMPAAARDYLEASRPRGHVEDVRFDWRQVTDDARPPFQVRARLIGLGLDPVARIPGIDGFDAELRVRGDRAWLDLLGDDLTLDAPELFAAPLSLEALRGRLSVVRNNGTWSFQSHRLEVVNSHLSTVSRVDFQVGPGSDSPFLDLQTAFYRVDASRREEFLPVKVLRPRFRQWLSRAIVKADVPAGATLIRGPIGAFPFREREGTFLTEFAVHDAILEFHPRWPRAEELDVDIAFRGGRFTASADSGKILDLETDAIEIEIPVLKDPVVHLNTSGRSDLPALVAFLKATPLAERVGSRLGPLVFAGEADVAVDLKLPLKTRKPEVAGIVEFRDSQVGVNPWRLELSAVNGAVAFTQDSVHAETLAATLEGKPLELGISTERAADERSSSTVVEAQGTVVARSALQKYLYWLAPYAQGESDWQARIQLGPQDGQVEVRLKSNLEGTEFTLPEPLGKDADDAVSTRLVISNTAPSPDLELGLDYGLNLRFAGAVRPSTPENPLRRGILHFGSGDLVDPTEAGLSVDGNIARLPVDEWRALVPDEGSGEFPSWLHRVELAVGEARLGTLSFANVALEADAGGWRLSSDDERHRGHVTGGFPMLSQPVDVQLETLRHKTNGFGGLSNNGIDPRNVPAIRFRADSVILDERPVGSLSFRSETTESGLTIPDLRSESENHSLDAALSWERDRSGDRSAVEVRLEASDTGATLRDFGIYSDVEGAEGKMAFSGEWQAPLMAPELESIEGTFRAELGPGSLMEVRPGVGKLMGMFNLYDVGRRLQLDFRDVNSEGFAFDSIDAQARLGDGSAYFERVAIKGPAAQIEISGEVGLIDKDYDQEIVVTPEVSSTLPVAGLIAGGPAVGAALLLAGKVFQDSINRVARVKYSLTGSWEEPVFEVIEMEGMSFEDPLSKGGDQ